MKLEKISYKQMTKAFIGLNVFILFTVILFLNLSLKPKDSQESPVVLGNQTEKMPLKTKKFETSVSKLSFDYPEIFGEAKSITQPSPCKSEELIENITFSNYPDFIVSINVCNFAQDSFLNENEFSVLNDEKTIKFIGDFEENYKFQGYTSFTAKSTTSNKPLSLIKVLFNEKETSREEIQEYVNTVVKSIEFNRD